jgi:hypothetical protein
MKYLMTLLICFVFTTSPAHANFLDDLQKGLENIQKKDAGLSDKTVIKGLKEALRVGTDNAVDNVSKLNGYFKNPSIKIPLPEELRKMADILNKVGLQKDVDRFVKSMNRAAEKAGPKAADLFINAIKHMTFSDARKILKGSETAATEFFRKRTWHDLYDVFRPVVSGAMDTVGVTRDYKKLVKKYESMPFVEDVAIDLDDYVTSKALDGLFFMVGEEEKKIRKDPAARVTDLLKKVFAEQE